MTAWLKSALGKITGHGKTAESLDRRLRFLHGKAAARDLCEAAGFQPSPVQLKALAGLANDEERQALLSEWR